MLSNLALLSRGDLINKGQVDRVFEKHSPVAVMHFAALSQVGEHKEAGSILAE